VRNSYSHDFKVLLETAGLRAELRREVNSNPAFSKNWNTIAGDGGWEADSRYEHSITKDTALTLFSAVTDTNAGILPWIKRRW
jgi:hypothetical protein